MNSNFKISLEKPCMQNWGAMPRMQGGLFCGQCSKVVKDFTTMSDEELIATLTRKHEGELCGVFSHAQLEKTYGVEPVPERHLPGAWKLLLAGLLTFELPLFAQAPFAEKTAVVQNSEKKTHSAQPRYLKGKITNRQTKVPAKVNVALYSSRLEGGLLLNVSTDSSGHYEIRLPGEGLEKFFRLSFSDSAFNERSIVVDRDKLPVQLNVTMEPVPEVKITTTALPETEVMVTREILSLNVYSYGGIPPRYTEPIMILRPITRVRLFFWKVFHPVKAIKRRSRMR